MSSNRNWGKQAFSLKIYVNLWVVLCLMFLVGVRDFKSWNGLIFHFPSLLLASLTAPSQRDSVLQFFHLEFILFYWWPGGMREVMEQGCNLQYYHCIFVFSCSCVSGHNIYKYLYTSTPLLGCSIFNLFP